MSPSPSLSAAYSLIQQEEKHQSIARASDIRPNAVGFSAQISSPNTSHVSRGRPSFTCTHCGKSGHEISRCYQLIGYPDVSSLAGRGRGKGRGKGRGHGVSFAAGRANSAQLTAGVSASPHTLTSLDREGLSLSDSQWEQLVNLLRTPAPLSRLSGPVYEDADWSRN
ncbi:hypothetical protein V5N11_009986 [Cardamine amara subsp. amara]|uniref:CCHC-type domain-containing protein n=1 Tax=Cardamine amara subsp. amara TaxID=228776 RepID=A0ABD1BAA3_CARAN